MLLKGKSWRDGRGLKVLTAELSLALLEDRVPRPPGPHSRSSTLRDSVAALFETPYYFKVLPMFFIWKIEKRVSRSGG
ncbi:hypothetical protein LINPERHAP1_LOCUS39472 [Linum perenne]